MSDLEHVEILPAGDGWLNGRSRNDTSQFGEDGLIQAAIERIGEANRWCFEVGAGDGAFLSNTKRLRDAGWNAVLIEADERHFDKLKVYESEGVQVVREAIATDSLDRILAQCGAPEEMDFGSLDIDGQDFWAWAGMKRYSPRLMLVEFERQPGTLPPLNGPGQAGRCLIEDLGRAKGYTPLAATYVNLLFVRNDCL